MKTATGTPANGLRGKVIVVTRAAAQSRELTRALTRRGATVLAFPVVEFREPPDWTPLERAVATLTVFDWVLFTSQNTVRFFFEAARRCRLRLKFSRPKPRVAAVGAETRRLLEKRHVRVDVCPEKPSAAALFEALRGDVRGKRVLLPQSDRANPALAEQLRRAGATVEPIVAYQTVLPVSSDGSVLARIRRGDADAVVFASPSAVENFAEQIGRNWLERIRRPTCWVSIGPATSAALGRLGIMAVEANEASSAGLVRALAKYFGQQRRAATG